MDSTALLIADHNRVRGLFARFKEAQEADDAGTMAGLAEQIFTELRVHTTIEEEIFYPEVRQSDDGLEDMVAEGLEEHHVVDVLIEEAEALTPGEEAWVAKLTVLIENVEHHAGEAARHRRARLSRTAAAILARWLNRSGCAPSMHPTWSRSCG